MCSQIGTEPNSVCNVLSGECKCKEGYTGSNCDVCAEGFYLADGNICKGILSTSMLQAKMSLNQ